MNTTTKNFRITNTLGLHLRAAASLVQTANRFQAEIEIEKEGRRVNGKSLMGVLALGAAVGAEITVIAQGEDADEAISALSNLIQTKFGLGE